jgi:hypothetical protein
MAIVGDFLCHSPVLLEFAVVVIADFASQVA